MVGSYAIRKRMRAAGIFRDVAADGAGFLAGGIGSEVQAVLFDGAREVEIHNTWLDDGPPIFRIDFQNVVHARERDDDAASPRQSAAGESGARAAPDYGKTMAVGQRHNRDDVFLAGRENDGVRMRLFDGAVVFIEKQILGVGQHC